MVRSLSFFPVKLSRSFLPVRLQPDPLLETRPPLGTSAEPLTRSDMRLDDTLRVDGTAGGGAGRRRPAMMNGCLRADWGLRRRSGSQVRHFAMKSTKCSSLHRRAEARVLVFGRRRLPLALTKGRGAPVASAQLHQLRVPGLVQAVTDQRKACVERLAGPCLCPEHRGPP